MTRWARGHKKKHVDASSWEELQRSGNGKSEKGKVIVETIICQLETSSYTSLLAAKDNFFL